MFSFDPQDGFYALDIAKADRDYFTVDVRGQLYMLAGYGWGGLLNGKLEALGFWSSADERQHITWKELKAAQLAVESFLPHLSGRNVLLHEDN
eukprot:jgi/Tetstr1/423997/TSEL_014608.t1